MVVHAAVHIGQAQHDGGLANAVLKQCFRSAFCVTIHIERRPGCLFVHRKRRTGAVDFARRRKDEPLDAWQFVDGDLSTVQWQTATETSAGSCVGGPIVVDAVMRWVNSMLTREHHTSDAFGLAPTSLPAKDEHEIDTKLPPGIKFIECTAGIRAFVKCLKDDEFCPRGA